MENLKIRCKSCGSELEGKTGKTDLVGPDSNMRNISRFLVENPDTYLKEL